MKALAVLVGIAVWLASTAATVEANGRRGQARGDFRGFRHFGGHHHHRGFLHRPFFPFVVGPSVVVTSPVVVMPPPAYVAPPMIYGGPPPYAYYGAGYAPPPPPPPAPRVVEFPTGRYELRGDGVSTPYSWVWIPNPPVAPPPTEPSAPAAPPPAGSGPASRPPAALYRWTDEQGVTTWTDNPEKIPARYRARTGRLTL